MNILYLDWPCFGKIDVLFTLEQMGHTVTMFFHEDYIERKSKAFDDYFDSFMEGKSFDFCFSYNYYALVSQNCKKHNLKYVSFVYDSPQVMLYSYTLINPNNYVFLFDKQQYLEFKNAGINTVYYSVLPVNSTIIDFLETKEYDHQKLSADVSFVGALYHEDHTFFDRLGGLGDYTKGYLDGIMAAQLKVFGYNFIEELLTKDIVDDLMRVAPYQNEFQGVETPAYIYANYFIDRKLTQTERVSLLSAVAKKTPLKLFTLDRSVEIDGATNMGAVDYYSEMPYVFHNSKINLNITLRSIKSGIPLRCMDILGAGGFLLTNFQADFLDYFVPNEDFVFFEDEKDLVDKTLYYLEHEDERKQIAANGHKKVKELFSYEKCFQNILNIISDS